MVHERTSSGAGLRPAAAICCVPRPRLRPPPDRPLERPSADALVEPGPVVEAATEPPPAPGRSRSSRLPLDPRAIARASLAARPQRLPVVGERRDRVSRWCSRCVGTRAGSVVLAASSAACAIVRWVMPAPGPVALSVRARWIDVTVLSAHRSLSGSALFAAVLPDGWV